MFEEANWVTPVRRDPIIEKFQQLEEERIMREARSRRWFRRREDVSWSDEKKEREESDMRPRVRPRLGPEEGVPTGPSMNMWEDVGDVIFQPCMGPMKLIGWYDQRTVGGDAETENASENGDIEWLDPDNTDWPKFEIQVVEFCEEHDLTTRSDPDLDIPETLNNTGGKIKTRHLDSRNTIGVEAEIIEVTVRETDNNEASTQGCNEENEYSLMNIPGGWVFD